MKCFVRERRKRNVQTETEKLTEGHAGALAGEHKDEHADELCDRRLECIGVAGLRRTADRNSTDGHLRRSP